MEDLASLEGRSTGEIARELNRQGFPTRSGADWSHTGPMAPVITSLAAGMWNFSLSRSNRYDDATTE